MRTQETLNFERIKNAIEYIDKNHQSQPSLDEIAEHIHLSPYHFQRLFTDWAGVSPKRFLQYINVEYAKRMLRGEAHSLSDTAYELGLSGTSHLHDLFITIEGMTPGEYKNGGEGLYINYSFAESPFGEMLIASTPKGICYMAFAENEQEALNDLEQLFPNASYRNFNDQMQQNATSIFNCDWQKREQVKLHIKGTDFQLKVWEALLKIPAGYLSTYDSIANKIDNPKAVRAVGTAIGENPVAYLIPCHRVIRSSGAFGQYHWGSGRKIAMIGWEGFNVNK